MVQGDRLDLLAARLLGDAELWWRIADANPELDPEELTRPDRTVAAHHAARRGTGGAPMLSGRVQLTRA